MNWTKFSRPLVFENINLDIRNGAIQISLWCLKIKMLIHLMTNLFQPLVFETRNVDIS